MALRTIVTKEDGILRKKSKEVKDFGLRTHELLDDLWETLAANNGVGLAAPQVGVLRRAIVIDVTPDPPQEESEEPVPAPEPKQTKYEMLNPVMEESFGETKDREGCLSVPGFWGDVSRPERVKVRGLTRDGDEYVIEADGLLARALCHEIDHLEGVLFTDKAESLEEI